MMLAYRRGLLEPDYKYGMQSRIREKLILDMLSKEQMAESLTFATLLRCVAIAPAIKPEAAVDYAAGLKNAILKVAYLKEYSEEDPSSAADAADAVREGSVNLVKAFNMLKERGIIEEFRKAAEKAVEDSQEDS